MKVKSCCHKVVTCRLTKIHTDIGKLSFEIPRVLKSDLNQCGRLEFSIGRSIGNNEFGRLGMVAEKHVENAADRLTWPENGRVPFETNRAEWTVFPGQP